MYGVLRIRVDSNWMAQTAVVKEAVYRIGRVVLVSITNMHSPPPFRIIDIVLNCVCHTYAQVYSVRDKLFIEQENTSRKITPRLENMTDPQSYLCLFSHKPIIEFLSAYLGIEDWFALSATCRYMYHIWISKGLIGAAKIRVLILERFGWSYKVKNPFLFVRKIMSKARYDPKFPPAKFRCIGGCGKKSQTRSTKRLALPGLTRYTICGACFRKRCIANGEVLAEKLGLSLEISDTLGICMHVWHAYGRTYIEHCRTEWLRRHLLIKRLNIPLVNSWPAPHQPVYASMEMRDLVERTVMFPFGGRDVGGYVDLEIVMQCVEEDVAKGLEIQQAIEHLEDGETDAKRRKLTSEIELSEI